MFIRICIVECLLIASITCKAFNIVRLLITVLKLIMIVFLVRL